MYMQQIQLCDNTV